MLLGMLTLGALLGGALATLAPAAAQLPEDMSLTLRIDDEDGVVAPGEEFNVIAEFRWPGSRDPAGGRLHVRSGTLRLGSTLDWEDGGRQLTLSNLPISSADLVNYGRYLQVRGTDGELLTWVERMPANDPLRRAPRATIRAMDGRTAVARANVNPDLARLYIFDLWNNRQVASIDQPAGAVTRNREGFAVSQNPRPYSGKALAVWHETDSVAWLFAGSFLDSRYDSIEVGSLYIWRLTWAGDAVTSELVNTIYPERDDACNTWATHQCKMRFGTSVALSADGRTLAVGANMANERMGAVYVYTRPESAGGWADLSHADAVKATTATVPAWGTSWTDDPIDPTSADACADWCRQTWSAAEAELGKFNIGLSRDGSVMVVGAILKRYPFGVTPPFSNHKPNNGEAYVFYAAGGDWQAAATDATNGKTLFPPQQDATSFDPETHYSPGPRLRITAPTTILQGQPWANANTQTFNNWLFGQFVDVTLDGTTVAVGTGWNSAIGCAQCTGGAKTIRIYQLAADETWESLGAANPTGLTHDASRHADANQQNQWIFPMGGIGFTASGEYLVAGNMMNGNADPGEVCITRRAANGVWSGDQVVCDDATLWGSGTPKTWHGTWASEAQPNRGAGSHGFGQVVFSLDRQRLSIGAMGQNGAFRATDYDTVTGPGRSYLVDFYCSTREADGLIETICSVPIENTTVIVPPGTADGKFEILGEMQVSVGGAAEDDVTLRGTVEVEIGTVKPVGEVNLDFWAGPEGTSPSSIDSGERTLLQLQVLTERGLASPADELSSIIVTTTMGTLSWIGSPYECLASGAGGVCRLPAASLANADLDNLVLTLRHSGTAGTARVDAVVTSKAGEVLRTEAVAVTLTGPATALNIAAPTGGVLNVGTPDAGGDTDEADVDDRDLLRLSVTAADANGAKVTVPAGRYAATLTGPDGRRVTNGVAVEWPLGGAATPTRSAAGDLQAQVDVDRSAGQALANGEYTLSLRADTLRAEQKFMVSGAAATVTLSEPSETPAVQGQFTITATIVDAAGESVPNGTRVAWSNLTIGDGSTTLVQTGATTRTVDGKATSTWLAVAHGRASVRATADTISNVVLVTVPDPSPPAPPTTSLADMLSSRTPGAPTSWLGESSVQASDLVAALEGVNTILLWQYDRWIRYGVEAGRVIPGSYDFVAESGAVLWLGGG